MLSLEDLAATSGDARQNVAERQRALAPKGAANAVAVPAAPVHERRAHRQLAYAAASDDAGAWDAAAAEERKAPALHFGKRVAAPASVATITAGAATPLERRVDKILAKAGAADATALRKSEAAALENAGVDEAEAERRRAELSKTRSLLFFAERKAKRVRRAGRFLSVDRGDAAAFTRIVRGNESRRRRGRNADIPWERVAATPRPRRGHSLDVVAATPRLRRGYSDKSHASGTSAALERRSYPDGATTTRPRSRGGASTTAAPRRPGRDGATGTRSSCRGRTASTAPCASCPTWTS